MYQIGSFDLYWNQLYFSGSISDLRGFGSGLARFEAGSAAGGEGGQLAKLAHVKVEELNDDELAAIIEELKVTVRRLGLEAIMFEGTFPIETTKLHMDLYMWFHCSSSVVINIIMLISLI